MDTPKFHSSSNTIYMKYGLHKKKNICKFVVKNEFNNNAHV